MLRLHISWGFRSSPARIGVKVDTVQRYRELFRAYLNLEIDLNQLNVQFDNYWYDGTEFGHRNPLFLILNDVFGALDLCWDPDCLHEEDKSTRISETALRSEIAEAIERIYKCEAG